MQTPIASAGALTAAGLAGWVVAAPGEPADPDGLRPMGAVRDLLLELIAIAGLDERERTAVCVRFGLVEYPASDPVRRLSLRLPVLRERGGDGLGEHRLSQLVTSAVRSLDWAILDRELLPPGERAVAQGAEAGRDAGRRGVEAGAFGRRARRSASHRGPTDPSRHDPGGRPG